MIAPQFLPLVKKIRQKSVYRLFKIQIAVNIEIPHLGAHLDEQVQIRGGASEDDFRIFRNHPTGHPISFAPHLINLTPNRALVVLQFLVDVNASISQPIAYSPHLRPAHVLVFKSNFHRVQSHCGGVLDHFHEDHRVDFEVEGGGNGVLHTDVGLDFVIETRHLQQQVAIVVVLRVDFHNIAFFDIATLFLVDQKVLRAEALGMEHQLGGLVVWHFGEICEKVTDKNYQSKKVSLCGYFTFTTYSSSF